MALGGGDAIALADVIAAEPGEPEIQLKHFKAFKEGAVTLYDLQLTDGSRHWTITRRYSEFLRCHVRLLERFGRQELPELKEPLLKRVFRGRSSEWAE
eukprot:CAMPEP_0115573682 /NCGR_PEP_ID=MMETSP0272-20121206/1128_1 /TAXON_ID=71861 /ORGANISM="Scrippsiella trochoidea, Strain CCMP3099" /LENGTH=97 /DNA_ID=CAMNT_0003008361 /DNA_START=70 /DNA_END=360 /DNA_ORIENTATION=+